MRMMRGVRRFTTAPCGALHTTFTLSFVSLFHIDLFGSVLVPGTQTPGRRRLGPPARGVIVATPGRAQAQPEYKVANFIEN